MNKAERRIRGIKKIINDNKTEERTTKGIRPK